MRLGKPVEHLQSATKALNEEDPFARFTIVGRQIGYAIYLFWDTFGWVSLIIYLLIYYFCH
jgi:peroxin-11B